jgi:hypothetical protein
LEPDESLFKRDKLDNISCTGLFTLMMQIRKQLINGDYRALYALWEKYYSWDEGMPPKPKELDSGLDVISNFSSVLADSEY